MDTSKEYIAQCDCPEIQDLHKEMWPAELLESGNYYGDYEHKDAYLYCGSCDDRGCSKLETLGRYNIWLPRQDQLQEMVIEISHDDVDELIYDFNAWNYNRVRNLSLNSMEKIWLSYIMKEKFNKTWKDGKWDE